MTLESIYYISQTIAVVAVLISLIFVGIQLRQSTQATMVVVYESAMDGFNEINRFALEDAELSSLIERGFIDATALQSHERGRFEAWQRAYANHLYKLFRLYEKGAFPEKEWQNAAMEAKHIFSFPGNIDFLKKNRYFADLRDHLDTYEITEFSDFKAFSQVDPPQTDAGASNSDQHHS